MRPDAFDAIAALAERSAYRLVDPPILQPADRFLELIGEDIRRRAFLTSDGNGREFCLRPDFTIPVSMHHLESTAARKVGAYAYCGPIFRFSSDDSDEGGEINQAGFENFGRPDLEAADAEMLGLALEAAADLGLDTPTIRMGDAGLCAAMLDSLNLPPAWRRRLGSDLKRSKNLDADLARLSDRQPAHGAASYMGFLAALEGTGHDGARAAVVDLLAIAGIQPIGGRTIEEIADRFLEQATLSSGGGIAAETVDLLRRFFAVCGDPDEASLAMRAIARDGQLDMAAALDRFDLRAGFFAAHGIDVHDITFSTAFGRTLDYYTGFMFELYGSPETSASPVVGGGRYDRLLSQLGSPHDVPAIGCSIWLDRFPGASR